eukprot:1204026-Prymnesium_polylepis.1
MGPIVAGPAHHRTDLRLLRASRARTAAGLAFGGLVKSGRTRDRCRRTRARRVRSLRAHEAVEEAGAAHVGVVPPSRCEGRGGRKGFVSGLWVLVVAGEIFARGEEHYH